MQDTRFKKPILMMALQPNCVVSVSQFGDEWRMDIRHIHDYGKFTYGQDVRGYPIHFTKKGVHMTFLNAKTLMNRIQDIEASIDKGEESNIHIKDNIYVTSSPKYPGVGIRKFYDDMKPTMKGVHLRFQGWLVLLDVLQLLRRILPIDFDLFAVCDDIHDDATTCVHCYPQ